MFANLGRRHPRVGLAVGCGICAALGVAAFWGFTVDDALVTARVAWRLANGVGYRFNASGPVVDAVTPLGWVYLLVPFARTTPLGAFSAAQYLGAAAWIIAATWLGSALAREGKKLNLSVLLLLAAPLGAWASAGMETGVVLGLATAALGDSWFSLLAIGLVAALRPEVVPFCTVLGTRHFFCSDRHRWRSLLHAATATIAFACTACIRYSVFGSAIPLAAVAKPSDLSHGVRYALSALIFIGPTWMWFGPGWKKVDGKAKWLASAVVAHFVTLVVIGGDWMPLWRLALPAMPAMFWVANSLHAVRGIAWRRAGGLVAMSFVVLIGWKVGVPARHVARARRALVRDASPLLKDAHLVAGLDVGWLGVATASDIMDLAGITDPRMASLPGGHTTKRIPNSWFDFQQPDALVLLTAPGETLAQMWWQTRFARGVENRTSELDYWRDCAVRGRVPLRYTQQFYVIVRCK